MAETLQTKLNNCKSQECKALADLLGFTEYKHFYNEGSTCFKCGKEMEDGNKFTAEFYKPCRYPAPPTESMEVLSWKLRRLIAKDKTLWARWVSIIASKAYCDGNESITPADWVQAGLDVYLRSKT